MNVKKAMSDLRAILDANHLTHEVRAKYIAQIKAESEKVTSPTVSKFPPSGVQRSANVKR